MCTCSTTVLLLIATVRDQWPMADYIAADWTP
jgi:hypothetical protein